MYMNALFVYISRFPSIILDLETYANCMCKYPNISSFLWTVWLKWQKGEATAAFVFTQIVL